MRTRLAVTGLLVMGMLMSGTGAALGVSGLSSMGDASEVQYGTNTETTTTQTQTTQTQTTQTTPPTTQITPPPPPPQQNVAGTQTGGNEVLGETEAAPAPKAAPSKGVQATQQVSAPSGNELPFTGYLAIPILALGIVLVGTGIVLRRKSAHGDA